VRGKEWLESVQHNDGGWGERCNTYDDPVFKGRGPSTASQTAWAVMALCAFDDPNNPHLQRGVDYLMSTQNADGSWTEHETTGTGFPKVFYLKYDIYRNAWPLLALSVVVFLLIRRSSSQVSSRHDEWVIAFGATLLPTLVQPGGQALMPVAVGLGVRDGVQAAEVAGFADGVIVGSAFVQRLLAAPTPGLGVTAVADLAAELAAGVRAAARPTERDGESVQHA